MPFVGLVLLAVVFLPILIVIALLFAVIAGVWNFASWLSQFPSWLIAMTVVLGLLAALCFVMAVTAW